MGFGMAFVGALYSMLGLVAVSFVGLLGFGIGWKTPEGDIGLSRRNARLLGGALLAAFGLLGIGKNLLAAPSRTSASVQVQVVTPSSTDKRPPIARLTASAQIGTVPFTVIFNACNSTSFNGRPEYNFQFGDEASQAEGSPTKTISRPFSCMAKHTYNSQGTFNASVTVVDAANRTSIFPIKITVPPRRIKFDNLWWDVRAGNQASSNEYWSNASTSVRIINTKPNKLFLAVRSYGTHVYQAEVYTEECFDPGQFRIYLYSRPGGLQRAGVAAEFLAEADPSHSPGIRFGAGISPSYSNVENFVVSPNTASHPYRPSLGPGFWTTYSLLISKDSVAFNGWAGHVIKPNTVEKFEHAKWTYTMPPTESHNQGYRVRISLSEALAASPYFVGGEVVVSNVVVPPVASCN